MDNMAYLQQIAVDGKKRTAGGGDGPLSKIFNKWTLLIGGGVLLLLTVVLVLFAAFNKVDTKDQDLMNQSYWMAQYLSETTLNEYADQVKNSDIRNMTASLKSVLKEIVLTDAALLESEYGIAVDETEEDSIATSELEKNNELNNTLEDGRLNGILDRTFLREITMQIAYLISYQSECAERTKNNDIKNFSIKAETNLQNLYDQFYNFSSPTI